MKALEDDADYKLKTLKENDMENKDIDAIKARLKVNIISHYYFIMYLRNNNQKNIWEVRHIQGQTVYRSVEMTNMETQI